MKIAIVRRQYSLQKGGAERYCVTLTRQLMRLGHNVTFVGEGIDDDLKDEVPFLPVRVRHTSSWTKNRSFAENTARVIARGKFDVSFALGRALGVDVFRVTERLQSHWLNVYYPNRLTRFLQRLNPRHRTLISLERELCESPQVRRVLTISQLDRRLLQEYYREPDEKICTIYNGVDTERFHPSAREHAAEVRAAWGIEPGEPLLLFASMDFAGKGLRAILQSMQQMTRRDVKLLVLGHGPVRRFAAVARKLGLAGRVVFAGRQNGMERFYSAADLFLLPTTYEPFPNVVLESLASGVPVLTTSTAGGADVVIEGENGYVISHGGAVGEMTHRLDSHFHMAEPQRTAMSQSCRQAAEGRTIENNARQIVELFEEVIREKSSRMGRSSAA